MADEIAAAKANLKKAAVDNSAPVPSTNDMFVSKATAKPAGDVRNESRLTDNGLGRTAVDKNAIDNEHDFASVRAGLKKTGSAPAVKAAAEQKVPEKNGKVVSNGMDRTAEDKNAVSDEHDFANLRAGLKKTGSAPAVKAAAEQKVPEKNGKVVSNGMDRTAEDKNAVNDEYDFASLRAGLKKPGEEKVPDKKVEAAKAKTPGAAGEVMVSNQMFVAKKAPPKAAGDVRAEKDSRLKNNGMDRTAEDKNAVSDEHDFANLRANLRKTN
eukprot:TRINITY_DN5581_c0_g2_i1.p1 TRINITY_DN5581_c0_g2~~TRINITY_DN5581_c0_g2_i1.p1  ORF type:complete len:287 (+),score=106.94 TRINITY_DN5581_c0_g2_i1:60-863(+)